MQRTSIWRYIFLGTCLRYLEDAQADYPVHVPNYILTNVNHFLKSMDELGLIVTKHACYQLVTFRDELVRKPADSKLTREEASRLRNIAATVRNTLAAEGSGKAAYFVTDKRIDVQKLISNVSALMAPNVYDSMSELSRFDFGEAGKCIAFDYTVQHTVPCGSAMGGVQEPTVEILALSH